MGLPQPPSRPKSVGRGWCVRDRRQCTDTGEVRIILLNKGTLWANVLGIFSRGTCAHPTVRYGETSSLRSDVCSSLLAGWE